MATATTTTLAATFSSGVTATVPASAPSPNSRPSATRSPSNPPPNTRGFSFQSRYPGGTPCRRENGAGCPPTPMHPWPLEAVMQSGAGARPPGSRTVAWSTPIRVPVPHRAPGQPDPTPTMAGGRLVAQDGETVEVEAPEELVARVAAIDVAKASGMVCTRVPHPAKPGQRATKVWQVPATTNAIIELAEQLAGQGIQRVVV